MADTMDVDPKQQTRTRSDDNNPKPAKIARLGVGSSVSNAIPPLATDDFVKTLVYTKAHRLLPRGKTIYATRRKEKVMEMWKTMVSKNLTSMPVLNEKGHYFGFIDVYDVVSFIVGLFDDTSDVNKIDLEKIFETESALKTAEVHDIMQFPTQKRNPFHPANLGSSLFTIWEKLYLLDVHRVPIIDDEFQVKDIITQSMLIDFLYQNIGQIGDLGKKSLTLLSSHWEHSVKSIASTETPIAAFKIMMKENLQGMAVTNEEGKLVDNISLRDLKGVRPDVKVFWRLWEKISDYKSKIRTEFKEHFTPTDPIIATPESTLGDVVKLMATKHVHRVYIVDSKEEMKPIGVISQTDVIKCILQKDVSARDAEEEK